FARGIRQPGGPLHSVESVNSVVCLGAYERFVLPFRSVAAASVLRYDDKSGFHQLLIDFRRFAIGRTHHEHGKWPALRRPKDVGPQNDAVAHGNRDILFDDDSSVLLRASEADACDGDQTNCGGSSNNRSAQAMN